MPNAELIRRVGREREDTIDGFQPAFVGAVYGVQAAPDEVLAFYQRELERLTWRWKGRDSLVSGELRAWRWCKQGMIHRLAIFDPSQYARRDIQGGDRFATVLEASIVASVQVCQ